MENDFMGGQEMQDLAHLQSENGAVGAQPQKSVDEMGDDEFLEYLDRVKDGEKPLEESNSEGEGIGVKETQEEEPFIKFNTQADYQEDFNSKFNRRFGELKGILEMGRNTYGSELSDSEILQRIEQDMLSAVANNNGKNPEDFKNELELKKKADAYDRITKAENDKKEVVDRWIKEAESLKEFNPDFDMKKALENQVFMENLTKGKSVAESYLAAFMNQKQTKAPERVIKQNASGVSQGSTQRTDPSKMSDAEFDRYISGIRGNI